MLVLGLWGLDKTEFENCLMLILKRSQYRLSEHLNLKYYSLLISSIKKLDITAQIDAKSAKAICRNASALFFVQPL